MGFQLNPPYSNETVLITECAGNLLVFGPLWEQMIARGMQWIALILSVVFVAFYGYQSWKATCGWEVIYVAAVEGIKVVVEIYLEFIPPFMVYQINGMNTPWLKFSEWLLTCPVILIHLSNITGLKDEYSGRTMQLLVSDLGTICMGVTSALSKGWLKGLFFFFGVCYGSSTFYHASQVYIESYYTMPEGPCRGYVKWMAIVFFTSWLGFPVFFLLGMEGFQIMTLSGQTIGSTIIDLMSKNIWGIIGHFLRVKIYEHILIHGDVRRQVTVNAMGQTYTLDMFVDKEEEENDVRQPSAPYAKRDSFVKMKDNLNERGIDTRASLDRSAAAPMLSSGAVVLGVSDASYLSFFQDQFAQLPANVQIIPAVGFEQLTQALQQNAARADGALIAPEFLQQQGIVQQIKQNFNLPVAVFGWSSFGPNRAMIESCGADTHLEGPCMGASFRVESLEDVISQMQGMKPAKSAIMMEPQGSWGGGIQSGMGGMSPMGGMGGMGQMGQMGQMGGMSPMGQMGGMQQPQQVQMGQMGQNPQDQMQQMMMQMQQMQQSLSGMQSPNQMGMQSPGMQSPGMQSPSGMATPPNGMMMGQQPVSPGNVNLMDQLQALQQDLNQGQR